MGIFSRQTHKLSGDVTGDWSAADCARVGGHDQRTHVRDAGTENEKTVVDCTRCGWETTV